MFVLFRARRENALCRVARSFLASTSGGGGGGGIGGGVGRHPRWWQMPKDVNAKSNLQSSCSYASKSSKKRRHSESDVLAAIRSRVAVRSPSDVPDGSNRMEDIPEGVLYGEHNDPSEERHLETQTEEEKEILEALSGLLDEDGEIKAEDRFPPLEHFYQDARSLEKEKRQEREKVKQLEHTMRRVKKVDRFGASLGTGKRKTAVAQVRIAPATSRRVGTEEEEDEDEDEKDEEIFGEIVVNGKPLDEYFQDSSLRQHVLAPFAATNTIGLFDVRIVVHGGGLSGQSQAARLGVARSLQNYDPAFRSQLKPMGLLTRDSRVVERKKPGLKKARKAFQWVKR